MPDPTADPFVLLATLGDPSAAELCAALLRSEGIDSRLRGESLGPYRLTIGAMAATQIWVPLRYLEEARSLLEQGQIGDVEFPAPEADPIPRRRDPLASPLLPVLGLLLAALLLGLVLARLL